MEVTLPSIAVDQIRPSPFNHRKTFTGLEELGASIKAKGLIMPIVVRPSPPAAPTKRGAAKPDAACPYELVCGERRWRAAKLVGVGELLAIIRDLSDVEVLELQLIENVQRSDVHPLEEADGYHELISRHGYTVEGISERTGKSKSWVHGRLKLCELVPEARDAFLADKFSAAVALALARIPDADLQAEATKGVLSIGKGDDDIEPPAIREEGSAYTDVEPMTTKQALVYLQRRFSLRLDLARFPLDHQTLVPDALDCVACTYRTGNQRDLFADVASPDICTRPPCYERKSRAWFELQAASAKARGVKVLAPKDADRVFDRWSPGKVAYGSPYIEPGSLLGHTEWPDHAKSPPSFAKLLGKKLDEVPRVLVQAPTGEAFELIDREAALKLAKATGALKKPAKTAASDNGEAAARRALAQRRAVVSAALPLVGGGCSSAFKGDAIKESLGWWRWLATSIADLIASDDANTAAAALRLEAKRTASSYDAPRRALRAEIENTSTAGGLRLVIGVLLASQGAAGATWSPGFSAQFRAAAKLAGVDLAAIAKQVAADAAKAEPKKKTKPTPAPKKGRKS